MTRVSSVVEHQYVHAQASLRAEARTPVTIGLLKLWLCCGSWCACIGWILSAVHQLNGWGYSAAALATCVAVAILGWRSGRSIRRRPRLHLPWRRYRHPLPFIYLVLLAGSVLGGILHAPNNYDMLTYRIPRLLNWLAEGRWHWINGYIDRMNYSGTGWEWIALPLILLTRNTSLFFLINIISYLFLPGLFFAFLRGFGVGRRMAWAWMWLLPAGLNFVMQAGGGANDTVAVVYLLAAMFFVFRGRKTGQASDVLWSAIAAALMTAGKASNLPLILPYFVAVAPQLSKLKRRLPAACVVLAIALLSSLLPTLLINYKFTHDWAGSPEDATKLKIHNPVAGVLGNTLELVAANLQPPVMPLAEKWNEASKHLLPASIDRFLLIEFPRFTLHMGELPQEEQAGLGIGLTAMAVISLAATIAGMFILRNRFAGAADEPDRARIWRRLILIAGWIALLALMSKLGSESMARLASPYYPILIVPLLLHPINSIIARRRWWKICAVLASLAVVPGLILTPSRPLFPAVSWTASIARAHPTNNIARRAAVVYSVYAKRAENLAPLRKYLPADPPKIGLIASSDASETALWEPLGTRQAVELLPADGPAKTRAEGIRFVVLGTDGLNERNSAVQKFLATFGGKIIDDEMITLKVTEGPEEWYVVDLQ